jgi:hypothetical protein
MRTSRNHRYPTIEGELESEWEDELESEWEDEDESEWEDEDEAFLGALGGIARTVGSLLGEGEEEYEDEDEAEFEFEFEAEAEAEAEWEDEAEGFANPVSRIYRDAELMAHLGTRAAETESEEEAEAFIGALVPIAARLIPRAASLVARNAPALIRGATRISRQLRRNPRTRRLVQAMPVILQRTAQSLADQAANGTDIDPSTALDTLGTITQNVLSGGQRRRAVGAVQVFNRRYQRQARRPMTRSYGYAAPRGVRRATRARRTAGRRRVPRR